MSNLKNNKSICAALWTHFMIKPDGKIKPCCRFISHNEEHGADFNDMNINDYKNISEIFNSTGYTKIKEKMLAGEKVSGCEKCYWEEETTGDSMRTDFNKQYGIEPVSQLRYLEATFGNYCNLSCRTCNGGLSTHWHQDEKKLQETLEFRDKGNQDKVNVDFNWNPEDFSEIDKIKFTGGEPMLHPDFVKFLDVAIAGGNTKNTELEIFTNASWIPKEKIFDKLNKFGKVVICLSVDGYKTENDYIRNNSDWNTTDRSINAWLDYEKDNSNFFIKLAPTLSIYNIFSLIELVKHYAYLREERGLKLYKNNPIITYAMYPTYTSLNALPGKREIFEKIKENGRLFNDQCNNEDIKISSESRHRIQVAYKKIMTIILSNINEDKHFDAFWKYTKSLDKIRNQNFKEAIPELYEHIIKYKPELGNDYE